MTFRSPFAHGFFRAAACTPRVTVADPAANLEATLALAREASDRGAGLAVFPELGISAYTNDDLFFQDALLDSAEEALRELRRASENLTPILVVGAPLRAQGRVFNCAVVVHRGRFLCVVPKTYIPNYREFYEKRYFASAVDATNDTITLDGVTVPFGTNVLAAISEIAGCVLHVEICEDLWAPVSPSSFAALAGATVLVNLSASNITIAKAEYRRLLCASASGKAIAAYVYSGAGFGESTTDLAWDGHAMIYENGELLAESERFAKSPSLVIADIDLDRLRQDRARTTSFGDCASANRELLRMRTVETSMQIPERELPLERRVPRFPFVPADPVQLDERCAEIYAIQVQGLAKRMQAAKIEKAVIGVSGGVDSAQAAVVTAQAFDLLGLPRSDILAYSMPGFATGETTRENARALMSALGVSAHEIDIRPSALQMLRDIGHPYAHGEHVYDITFENVQAGERTSHLFRLANQHGALVVGTSDLSELALGYTTYGVGDHMSHYAVNSSVPKTLIRFLLSWTSHRAGISEEATRVLQAILDTPISPELVPGKSGEITQAEATVGPYALTDFFLYYISRFGYRPSKVAYMAEEAWRDAARGAWPAAIAESERIAYDLPTIKRWLALFLQRFFATSQYKRSALPNGPKVGSGGSLSPRSDWRAPSDGGAQTWLDELNRDVP
jgi:NAD+ synthase (glutamine-hydrolysing)